MKIFRFESTNYSSSCCAGEYFFIADDLREAQKFARAFESGHNAQVARAYKIRFNSVKAFPILKGHIPLTRGEA